VLNYMITTILYTFRNIVLVRIYKRIKVCLTIVNVAMANGN